MNPRIPFVVFCNPLLILVAAQSAPAALLVYEPFNYTTGQLLNGQNGGAGFNGPWTAPSNFTISPNSLSTPSDPGTGKSADAAANFFSVLEAQRPLTSSFGTTGSDLWASYLTRVDSLTAFTNFSLGSGTGGLHAGILGGPNGVGPPSATWGMDGYHNIGPVLSQVPVVYGQTTLLVMHVTFLAGPDRADLYVNPMSSSPPAQPDATKTDLDLQFNDLEFRMDNGNILYDEIRLGTTYADVVPVPEPCSAILLSLGIAGILGLRFRAS
jgi:hypothetical protein